MKPVVLIGILLIGLGIVSLVYQGIPYTSEENVLDIGPLKATAKTEESIPLPPIVGGIALATGTALVVTGLKKH
jgi:hypothetical protein